MRGSPQWKPLGVLNLRHPATTRGKKKGDRSKRRNLRGGERKGCWVGFEGRFKMSAGVSNWNCPGDSRDFPRSCYYLLKKIIHAYASTVKEDNFKLFKWWLGRGGNNIFLLGILVIKFLQLNFWFQDIYKTAKFSIQYTTKKADVKQCV